MRRFARPDGHALGTTDIEVRERHGGILNPHSLMIYFCCFLYDCTVVPSANRS